MNKVLLSAVTFVALSLSFAVSALAQETGRTPAPVSGEERLAIEIQDQKESSAVKNLKLEKEYKPRLPNGFGPSGVGVDAAQKAKIYEIMREYNEVIAMLELRLKLLKQELDAKVDAVLTPAQQQRLNRPVRTLLPR